MPYSGRYSFKRSFQGSMYHFTLHVDVDGTDPLNVVSGTIAGEQAGADIHFIGRATNTPSLASTTAILDVGDFNFQWPDPTDPCPIDRLTLHVQLIEGTPSLAAV